MTQTLAEKMAAAREAAAASVQPTAPAVGQEVALAAQPGGLAAPVGGRKDLLTTVMNTFTVDKYIKVSKEGMGLIIDTKLITQPIPVVIDFSEVITHTAIKGGKPVRYEKTYDGYMARSGKPWQQAIADIQMLEPSARPYDAFSIAMIAVDDVKVGDVIVAPAGTRLGYDTPTTGKGLFAAFVKEAVNAGVNPNTGKCFAEIACESRSGGGNTWGLMTFKFLAPFLSSLDDEAA